MKKLFIGLLILNILFSGCVYNKETIDTIEIEETEISNDTQKDLADSSDDICLGRLEPEHVETYYDEYRNITYYKIEVGRITEAITPEQWNELKQAKSLGSLAINDPILLRLYAERGIVMQCRKVNDPIYQFEIKLKLRKEQARQEIIKELQEEKCKEDCEDLMLKFDKYVLMSNACWCLDENYWSVRAW